MIPYFYASPDLFNRVIMIVPYLSSDFQLVLNVINHAALAYKGVIPGDRWKNPYMTVEELQNQLKQGIRFWCYRDAQQILGIMGIQYKGEVTLIRHAYVHPDSQHRGIGSE